MKKLIAIVSIICGLLPNYSFALENEINLADTWFRMTLPTKKPDVTVIKDFYALLSNQDTDLMLLKEHAKDIVDENWNATPVFAGGQGLDGFATTFSSYHQAIPDMKWTVQNIYLSGSSTYTVRSIITGTPIIDFLEIGSDWIPGNHFEIMSIDIHTLKNGKIIKTFHVEDWREAMKQLKATNEN